MYTKLINLWSYVYDRQKYSRQLLYSIKHHLFDYSIILIWKTFILFLYEKIYQIPEENILKAWKNKFKKETIPGFKKDNLYWPNNNDDKVIIHLFYEIYDIDNNVLKTAESLSQKRDTAAHVSDIQYSLNDVDNYIDDVLMLCEKFQKCHLKILDQTEIDSLDLIIISHRYSKYDIGYLLSNLIKVFGKSSSFKESTSRRTKIIALKDYLTRDQIATIIKETIKNSQDHPCHQIIEAGGANIFLQEIYNLFKEPTKEWKKFAEFISQDLQRRKRTELLSEYNWLFQNFNMPTYPIPEETINIDDIPF